MSSFALLHSFKKLTNLKKKDDSVKEAPAYCRSILDSLHSFCNDRQTDRLTDLGIKAPSRSLRIK